MNRHYLLVAKRATHRCEYCHAPEAIFNFPFEVEHIRPIQQAGEDQPENLALACRSCNLFKSNYLEFEDLETKTVVELYDPRNASWETTFQANPSSGEIVGISASGRATVACLRMNSETQVAARLQWMRLGLFP